MIGKNRLVFLVLWSAAAWSYAGAQPPGRQQIRLVLQALDLNHDGKLSAEEIKAAPSSLLALDKNGDGQLTVDELTERPQNAGTAPGELVKQLMGYDKAGKGYLVPEDLPARMQGIFARADSNHDGKLTPEEISALSSRQGMPSGAPAQSGRAAGMFRMDPLLNALDTNHDGVIDAEEIRVASASLLTLDKNGDGEITADEMRMRQPTPEERANHLLDEFDTDKDGKISRAEAPERMAKEEFGRIDKNGDGFLDRDELIEFFKTQATEPSHDGQGGGRPQQ